MLAEPDERTNRLAKHVIDAAIEVHRLLGPGFSEGIYEGALAEELTRRSIPFERQLVLPVRYKEVCVGAGRVDLLVGGALIVELKAVEQLATVHVAQLISYLKVSNCCLGLLINFDVDLLRNGIRRVVQSRHQQK